VIDHGLRVGDVVESVDPCYMFGRRAEVIEVIGSSEVRLRFTDTDEARRWAPGEGVWPVRLGPRPLLRRIGGDR
jgi:hypothetical protein